MKTIMQSSHELVKFQTETSSDEYLSDISQKDQKFEYHKANTDLISDIYSHNNDYKKYGQRMSVCADILAFLRGVDISTGETKIKLNNAFFCKVRHCPLCSWRRSLRNTARFFEKLPQLREDFPKHRWLFLTLTVKNCATDNLKQTLRDMNQAWQRLIQRKAFPADGWIRTTEVTRSDIGEAHPHFHVLLMVPAGYFSHGYIKQQTWVEMWQDALRVDYEPMIDVRAVKAKRDCQTLEAAIVETLKYSTKVEDAFNNPDWLYVITSQLRGSRFIASGGALKGVLKEQLSNDEMIAGDEITEDMASSQSLLFGWKPSVSKYKRI